MLDLQFETFLFFSPFLFVCKTIDFGFFPSHISLVFRFILRNIFRVFYWHNFSFKVRRWKRRLFVWNPPQCRDAPASLAYTILIYYRITFSYFLYLFVAAFATECHWHCVLSFLPYSRMRRNGLLCETKLRFQIKTILVQVVRGETHKMRSCFVIYHNVDLPHRAKPNDLNGVISSSSLVHLNYFTIEQDCIMCFIEHMKCLLLLPSLFSILFFLSFVWLLFTRHPFFFFFSRWQDGAGKQRGEMHNKTTKEYKNEWRRTQQYSPQNVFNSE